MAKFSNSLWDILKLLKFFIFTPHNFKKCVIKDTGFELLNLCDLIFKSMWFKVFERKIVIVNLAMKINKVMHTRAGEPSVDWSSKKFLPWNEKD